MEEKDKKQGNVCMACRCPCEKHKEHDHVVESALPSKGNVTVYRCPECGLRYRDKETAARCEAWCKEHKSCNLDIIKSAIPE